MIRPMLGLLLALMLALTGQSMSVARGSAMAAGEVVLCTGQGAVVVAVDETGQPVGPSHICPDCALSVMVTDAPAPGLVPRRDARTIGWVPGAGVEVASRAVVPWRARGPPAVDRA